MMLIEWQASCAGQCAIGSTVGNQLACQNSVLGRSNNHSAIEGGVQQGILEETTVQVLQAVGVIGVHHAP